MSRTVATLTLMLGLVAVSAATYATATPVRFIAKTEKCPVECKCINPIAENGLMQVICPTKDTENIIDGNLTFPENIDDVIDVETFVAANSTTDETSEEDHFSLKDDVHQDLSSTPEASPSPSPSPSAVDPTDVPMVLPVDKIETIDKVNPIIDDEETFALKPDVMEDMLGDQPAEDDDYVDSTGAPIEVEPFAAEDIKKDEPSPSPTATPAGDEEEKMIVSAEEKSEEEKMIASAEEKSEEKKSEEEEPIVPSAAAEVTATPKPLLPAASTPEPEEKFSLPPMVDEPDSKDESVEAEPEQTPTAAPSTDVPLVFDDPIPEVSSSAPELEKTVVELNESIEDVLKPDEPTESSSTMMPKMMVDVDTNQLDESLTSEDLVLANEEMSGKMLSEDEAPGVTQAPEQSTASWVILGLILAMFVGVLLYAAIKGRLETGGQDVMPKLPSSISSVVASTGEYTKNRRPSDDDAGTEMREMSKALLGSPLEDRVSRFIDEDDQETIKRLLEQEADEILEQVVVEAGDARPVNNALEKPPRKFINVPPPVVPGRDASIPNTPTLVRAKMVDMSPEVHFVGNGNTTSLQ